jgi:hypothetical protein
VLRKRLGAEKLARGEFPKPLKHLGASPRQRA